MRKPMRFGRGRVYLIFGLMLIPCISLLFHPNRAEAGSVTFTARGKDSAFGSGLGGATVDAQAMFTTGSGTLSIVLTNLLTNERSAGQAISGIEFTLNTTPSSVSGSSDSGSLITVGSGGSVTFASGTPDRWEANGHITSSGSTIELLVLGGGKPTELILGPTSSDGKYDNANASITRNFSPWVENSATFNLSVGGITSSTTVSSATFFFGTGPEGSLGGSSGGGVIPQVGGVPAPPSVVLFGLGGLALIGFMARSRRRLLVAT